MTDKKVQTEKQLATMGEVTIVLSTPVIKGVTVTPHSHPDRVCSQFVILAALGHGI